MADNQAQQAQTDLNISRALADQELPGADVRPGTEFPDDLLESLLGGTPDGQSATSDDSEPDSPGTDEKPSLNTLADAAGGPDKLYKMTVSLGDEEGTATVEQLKDEALAARRHVKQRETFDAERTEFSNQKLKYMQELQYAAQALGPEALKDEKLAPVREFFANQQATEDRILKSTVTDWDDRKPDLGKFLSAEYGAPEGVLDQPAPAWVRKALYDQWQLHERMKGIATKRKAAKAVSTPRNSDTRKADNIRGAQEVANHGGDQIDAAVKLLFSE